MNQVGFGTWPLGGGAYGPVADDTASAAVSAALDSGIGLFDTANIYGDGRAEELIGRLVPKNSSALITSKAGYLTENGSQQRFSAAELRMSLQGSLRRLRRSELDIFLLHSPPDDVLEHGEAFLVLDRLREEGLVKRTGVSLRTVDSWKSALEWPHCQVIEVILNLLDQRPIDAGLVHAARSRNIQIIARVPLCFGFLSGNHTAGASFQPGDQRSRWSQQQIDTWIESAERFRFLQHEGRSLAQSAIAFCCSVPGVGWAIPGMKSANQVLHNARGGSPENLFSAGEMLTVRTEWQKLKHVPPGSGVNR